MPYEFVKIRYSNFRFQTLPKVLVSESNIFLIRCQALSRLALWTERTATKVEIVGPNLTTCRYIFHAV